ncbi:hypothetical protein SPI_07989 [Niveomyces insectorum RCEF 264]|uniref:Uncharacterized protein n=1 Tax=Niveomyces insectorum RCEF 264 TaxID=1081102 RepID=A0A167NPU3_9HYPO|nr:hypothetical protein SPI_07989 [Niveomyces insectorum RCEF 264]
MPEKLIYEIVKGFREGDDGYNGYSWNRLLGEGFFLPLLQCLAPNLATAHVHLSRNVVLPMMSQTAGEVSRLSLANLVLSSPVRDPVLDLRSLFIPLQWSNLAVLEIHGCSRTTALPPASSVPSRPSRRLNTTRPLQNLTKLNLYQMSMPATSLRRLLGLIGNGLANVTIQVPNEPFNVQFGDDDRRSVNFEELLNVLLPWKRTIKELSFYKDNHILSPISTNLDKLCSFEALEVLRTESAFFDFTMTATLLRPPFPRLYAS